MDVDHNINFVPRQFLSTSPVRDQATIDALSQAVPNPLAGRLPGSSLNGATVARQQLLLPYPQFTTVTQQRQSLGSSDFHALGVKVEKRFSQGLTFLATYTFSKLMETRSLLNDSDTQLEHRLAAEDRPQRFVISSVWEIPIFRHRRFGGWQIQGVYTAQSGTLLNWGNVIYYGGPVGLSNPDVDRWFNTAVFERTAAKQLGSNIRTFPTRISNVRSDGINNVDLSILKNTKITERVNFQVRVEGFNTLNHPAFSGATTDPTSSNFGKVTSQLNLPRQVQIGGRIVF